MKLSDPGIGKHRIMQELYKKRFEELDKKDIKKADIKQYVYLSKQLNEVVKLERTVNSEILNKKDSSRLSELVKNLILFNF